MPTDLHNQFATLTRQGLVLFSDLKQLLVEEHQALGQRDLEALQQTTEQKHQLLLQLEANIRERNQTLTLAGHSPSEAGFEQFAAELTPALRTQVLQDWQALKLSLDEVRSASKRNEQILARSKQNVDQLLNLLQGQADSNILYGPAGSKGHYTAQRSIGKA